MSTVMHRKSIVKKTVGVSGLTLASRFLGIIREFLMVRYLGASALSDVFIIAYRVPNSLRKIFAEGALSAAFIPTLVLVLRSKGEKKASSLMMLAFLFFEGIVLLLCAVVMWNADVLLGWLAPGFDAEQMRRAILLLRILMPFIFFVSSSALFAGALQAVNHFFVPAFSPVLLNIVFISGLAVCLLCSLRLEYLCFFILCGGFLQFCLHVVTYIRLFPLSKIYRKTWYLFFPVLLKFLYCLPSMGIMEVNLIVDGRFASCLAHGSISLLNYANRFMGIPLGVFATALATVLLPHFSRVSSYAPKRLSFYLLETAKIVFWVTLPVMLVMGFFAEKIFYTIFLSEKFVFAQVIEAGSILIVFLSGLSFFALNKFLLNFYYSLNNTWIPACISFVAVAINCAMNMILVHHFYAVGLAAATVISEIVRTGLLLFFLYKIFKFRFYVFNFVLFMFRYIKQLLIILPTFFIIYYSLSYIIGNLPNEISYFLLLRIGFWLWVGPLCILLAWLLFSTRKFFGLKLYFLD